MKLTRPYLYEGSVHHARTTDVTHKFTYSLFMVLLPLNDLDSVFNEYSAWSAHSPNLAWFQRSDHFGSDTQPLELAVRDVVEDEIGSRPSGQIQLLTHLRYFGYCFNPISFYFCLDSNNERVHSMVLEVQNTPWHEHHTYVLASADAENTNGKLTFNFDKNFHVSPFLPMDLGYRVTISEPAETFASTINCYDEQKQVLSASISMDRKQFTQARSFTQLLRHPLMTLKVIAAIYYEAVKLWWKGATYHAHPRTRVRD